MRVCSVWAMVLILSAVGCGSPLDVGGGGGAMACTEIGCVNGVTFAVSGTGLGADGGRVVAEVCFDGACERTRYTQQAGGASRSDNPQMDMFVGPDSVEVTLHLPEADYDEATAYEASLVLRVDGGEPIRVQRNVNLERSQPNGPDCPPICWQARIEHAA